MYGDADNYRLQILNASGWTARTIKPKQLEQLVTEVSTPDLLWIRLPGVQPGSHIISDSAFENIMPALDNLLHKQLSGTRHFMVEGTKHNPSWSKLKSIETFAGRNLSWCGMGIRGTDGTIPTNGTLVKTSLDIPDSFFRCDCTDRYRQHNIRLTDKLSIKRYIERLCTIPLDQVTATVTVPESITNSNSSAAPHPGSANSSGTVSYTHLTLPTILRV